MSQKTNPISLRLQNNNKHFESCWYSDFFYNQVLSDEVNLRFYIEGLLLQAGRSKTLPSIQSQYKRYCTLLFFLDQRAERHKREFSLKISREPVERLILPRTKFLQSKKKSFNKSYPWKNLLCNHNRVQDILCKEKVLEKERYKDVIEEVTKQDKSVFTNNGKQEYVYKYAIKDFSFELLFLAGLDSTKFFNTKSSNAYNCIVNPGLKQNMFKQLPSKTLTPAKMEFKHAISNPKPFVLNTKVGNFASPLTSVLTNKGSRTQLRCVSEAVCNKAPLYLTNSKGCSFYTESKDFFVVSLISFALCRLISYTQKPVFESPPLMPFSAHTHTASLTQRSCVREKLQQSRALLAQSGTKQAFNGEQALALLEVKYNSKLHTTKKGKDIPFLKSRLIKEPFSARQRMDSIFSVQKGHENLFRSLIIDKYSQGAQNRLSFWLVKGVNKTVANKAELCKQGVALHTHTTSHTHTASLTQRSCVREKLQQSRALLATKQSKPIKECTTFASVNMVDETKLKKNGYLVPQKWRTKSLGLARHTELFLNIYSGNFLYHTIYPVRAISPFQSASFLLESIAYLLQRKSSFRQIKDDIFRELDQYQLIKGARLSCAGRLGGRSKKAQKAKIQTAQWGETSLTVFSSRLAFASKGVKTTYGKVGVKLWLCYK